MEELEKLPNIGTELCRQLREVGVHTGAELCAVGSREVWLRIKQRDPSACYMRLCALEGALRGVRWHHLEPSVKAALKEFYNVHK